MIAANDFRRGMAIELSGEVYYIVNFQHHKPGKGGAVVRTRLKNVKTGNVIDKTFRAEERVSLAHLEEKEVQFLYRTGELFYFMDTETYEQLSLKGEQLGETIRYLKENLNIKLLLYEGEPMGIQLPYFVELKVASTEPGVRGDTVSGGSKPATLETGAVVQVPLFINPGDVIRIDTRTGEYIGRV